VWISKLDIQHCRVISQITLELSQHTNIIYGDNASGKSSILEALTILSRGRSFRTPRILEVIQRSCNELIVGARIEQGITGLTYPIGISKSQTNSRIRINHADVLLQSELSTHIPLTLIHPNSIELLTGSPQERRAFLDWIAFYRFPEFNNLWKTYQQVIKQRNACLRYIKQRYALSYWTQQLVGLQADLYKYRQKALELLNKSLISVDNLLINLGKPDFLLTTGFPQGVDIFKVDAVYNFFQDKKESEIKQGFTLYGAHKADFHVLLENLPVSRVASRGQLKLLAMVLLLAQSHAISDETAKRGIIAVDDLASELDATNQELLYAALSQTQQQLLITGTRLEPLAQSMEDACLFHVKQGQLLAN
jgi:DNA replication and repair protein RecF